MSAITKTLETYYNALPDNTAQRIGLSFLGSFALKAIEDGDWCVELKDSLAAGTTGAMFALFSVAVEPMLKACFGNDCKKTQAYWVAKCVIGLTATVYVAPALASLWGMTLKVNATWTALFTILQLTRQAWNADKIGSMDYSESPFMYLAWVSIVVPMDDDCW